MNSKFHGGSFFPLATCEWSVWFWLRMDRKVIAMVESCCIEPGEAVRQESQDNGDDNRTARSPVFSAPGGKVGG